MTERDYVKDLAILIEKYMESIRQNDIQLPSDFEGGKDKIVFGNIQQIYEWHKTYVYSNIPLRKKKIISFFIIIIIISID